MTTLRLPGIHHYTLPLLPDLIAGEYPGSLDRTAAANRLKILRQAGVTCFIDLTEEGELVPYADLLPVIETGPGPAALHRRFPIPDVSVPRSVKDMTTILDAIDRARDQGHRVYVHCWGGVGRTGTVAGCYLVRHGLSGDQALAEVGRLFGGTAKGRAGRVAPETEAQSEFVRTWAAPTTSRSPRGLDPDRLTGALVGLAVGDTLGNAVEFMTEGTFEPVPAIAGGEAFDLAPGSRGTISLALCLADSLIQRRAFDARDQINRYLRWLRKGERGSTDRSGPNLHLHIGVTLHAALLRYEETGEPFAGSTDPRSAGNGSLMRLAPIAIYFADRPAEAVALAADSSRTTHGAATAVDACRYFTALLLGAFRGVPKAALLSPDYADGLGFWHGWPLDPAIAGIAAGSFRDKMPPAIRGTGYVVESLEAALWAFDRSDNFAEGALAAVNLGDDADTTGAIYGQLAGAYYGLEGIPAPWREVLHEGSRIIEAAEALTRRGGLAPVRRRQAEWLARQVIADSAGDWGAALQVIDKDTDSDPMGGPLAHQAVWGAAGELIRQARNTDP